MKIILTGTSGFIGGEVLRQCLAHPSISSIITLSRRELSVAPHPKLQTVLVRDFENYEPSVLAALEGADGCIWSLGVKTSDISIQQKVSVDYTLAALRAFSSLKPSSSSSPSSSAQQQPPPFRFIFTSGILASRSPSDTLWFGSGARHMKGQGEREVLNFTASSSSPSPPAASSTTTTSPNSSSPPHGGAQQQQQRAFTTLVLRPGAVLDTQNSSLSAAMLGVASAVGAPAVSVQALAAVMVEFAVNGGGGSGSGGSGNGSGAQRVWENKALVVKGRELLLLARARARARGKEEEGKRKEKGGEL